MPKEKRPLMERLPFKPAPMDMEAESVYDGDALGWEDAPSSRWPTSMAASLDREPNRPSSRYKIVLMAKTARRLNGRI
jgi:hypothetical protein